MLNQGTGLSCFLISFYQRLTFTMNKSVFLKIATIILLIAGVCLLFYPAINNIIFVYNQNQIINDYNSQIIDLDTQVVNDITKKAQQYNDTLAQASVEQSAEKEVEIVSGNLAYSELLNIKDEQMGYIVIPKISLNQPVYHGTSDEVLDRGIGHMENTSLPIGGKNTHSVLTGHSGIPGMMLFTDLEKMEIGDKFYLKVLDKVLAYEVDSINVVLPNVTENFRIVEGEDLVTLVTCTPYGVNTHRLLVRGSRVEYNGEIDAPEIIETYVENSASNDTQNSSTSDQKVLKTTQSKFSKEFILYYMVIPAVISVILMLVVIIIAKKRKKTSTKA